MSLRGLVACDAAGHAVPTQWDVLSRWPDGSVRWALADFLASVEEGRQAVYHIAADARANGHQRPSSRIQATALPRGIRVDSGLAVFDVSAKDLSIRAALRPGHGHPGVTVQTVVTGTDGRPAKPELTDLAIQTEGPVRVTLHARGAVAANRRGRAFEMEARLSFFAGTGLVGAELTLRNPRAARHRGGCWDFGDPGSVLFRDFTVEAQLAGASSGRVTWAAEPGQPVSGPASGPVEIYQDSSGGENWLSRNHVNRNGRVPHAFRGYRVRSADGLAASGLRASPVLSLVTSELRLSGAIEQFWQHFPKALEGEPDGLRLRLFPRQFGDDFELLGGEQKTHRVWLLLEPVRAIAETRPLEWVHVPLVLSLDPAWYAAAGVFLNFAPASEDVSRECSALLDEALDGQNSFFRKREVIDEYGWRHFGDVYADHENAYYSGSRPVVSHYNNQYDLIYGLLLQFVRTGERRWFELARDLARHVIDIDLYHTQEDKSAYNGGLFWHTDHYEDAHRAGHRTYSKDSSRARDGLRYGGGPSNEHNYTSGLLLYHYLTGSPAARDAVLSLARWVIDMDDGARTIFGVIDSGPTGLASSTRSPGYHGPGRGAGNSINALLDAFTVSGEGRYLTKAEEIVRRCIHPRDDIDGRDLGNLEARWSYVVFLQALGKYLDLKSELGEWDRSWAYARESLLAYARWMLDHEVPYIQVLDRVEYPTETWPAHDLRKSAVFGYAAKYARPEWREGFLEAAEVYFRESLAGLAAFETRTCTRPLAILLQNAPMRAAWGRVKGAPLPSEVPLGDVGAPVPFESQKARVKKLLRSPGRLLGALGMLVRGGRLRAILRLTAAELRRSLP
jgi:YetA-like protein